MKCRRCKNEALYGWVLCASCKTLALRETPTAKPEKKPKKKPTDKPIPNPNRSVWTI